MGAQKNAILVITNEAKESAKRREAAKSNRGNLLGLLQDFVLRNDIRVILLLKWIIRSSHYYNRKR